MSLPRHYKQFKTPPPSSCMPFFIYFNYVHIFKPHEKIYCCFIQSIFTYIYIHLHILPLLLLQPNFRNWNFLDHPNKKKVKIVLIPTHSYTGGMSPLVPNPITGYFLRSSYLVTLASNLILHRPGKLPKILLNLWNTYFRLTNAHRSVAILKTRLFSLDFCFLPDIGAGIVFYFPRYLMTLRKCHIYLQLFGGSLLQNS